MKQNCKNLKKWLTFKYDWGHHDPEYSGWR